MNFCIFAITCPRIILCGYIAIDILIQSVHIKCDCSIMFRLKLLNSPITPVSYREESTYIMLDSMKLMLATYRAARRFISVML